MTTNNHPAHGPVSLERLHQIHETLSKAAAQSDGGNLGYAMADAVKVIDGALELRKADATPEFHTEASRFLPECLKAEEISGERRNSRIAELIGWFDRYYNGKANPKWFKSHTAELCYYILTAPPAPVVPDNLDYQGAKELFNYLMTEEETNATVNGWNECRAAMLQGKAEPASEPCKLREQVRREHAAWSQATFGDVGPVGPLKHLSKEAIEAAAEPGDLSEWADMQFLLWDAQRRAGISDEQITLAMVEKLAVNKQRDWPEPKEGEPRLHIKADQPLEDK